MGYATPHQRSAAVPHECASPLVVTFVKQRQIPHEIPFDPCQIPHTKFSTKNKFSMFFHAGGGSDPENLMNRSSIF
jgi:hypothetical protein